LKINPLNVELNPIRYLLALLGAHHILHVSRVRVKRSEKTKKSEIKKWDIGKLSKKEVKEEFIKKVTTNVKNTQNKWKIQMKYGTK